MWVLTIIAAAVAAGGDVSTLERWLPSLVTIGGVVVTAVITAFKVGNKFTMMTSSMAQLINDVGEQKALLKEMDTTMDNVRNRQTEHHKDIEHIVKVCAGNHPPGMPAKVEQPGGL